MKCCVAWKAKVIVRSIHIRNLSLSRNFKRRARYFWNFVQFTLLIACNIHPLGVVFSNMTKVWDYFLMYFLSKDLVFLELAGTPLYIAMKQIIAHATPATQYQSLRLKRRNVRQYSSQGTECCLHLVFSFLF